MNIIQAGFIVIYVYFSFDFEINHFCGSLKASCALGTLPAVTNGYVVPGNHFPLFFSSSFLLSSHLQPLLTTLLISIQIRLFTDTGKLPCKWAMFNHLPAISIKKALIKLLTCCFLKWIYYFGKIFINYTLNTNFFKSREL